MMKKDRRRISPEKAEEVITDFLKGCQHMSLSDFVRKYYDVFSGSHKNIKEIYDYLRFNEIDVGSYQTFRRIYCRVRQESRHEPDRNGAARKQSHDTENPIVPVIRRDPEATEEKQETQSREPPRKPNLGLRQITLPDGTPVDVDPETGAKTFKI